MTTADKGQGCSFGKVRAAVVALLQPSFLGGALLCIAVQAFATTIELSAADFYYFCRQPDRPGIVTVYVRTSFSIGTTASRFRVQASPEVTWSYISETSLFPTTLGNTQSGITICYDQCVVGQAVLVSINYMVYGTSPNCGGELFVLPHPDAQTVEVIDCDGTPSSATTVGVMVGDFCSCPSPRAYAGTPQRFDCRALPTTASTWGAVKALYRY